MSSGHCGGVLVSQCNAILMNRYWVMLDSYCIPSLVASVSMPQDITNIVACVYRRHVPSCLQHVHHQCTAWQLGQDTPSGVQGHGAEPE